MQVHDRGLLQGSGDRAAARRRPRPRSTPAAGSVELDGGGAARLRRAAAHDRLEPAPAAAARRGARRHPLPAHDRRQRRDPRADSSSGGHVAVIGSGWIGSEVAASARQGGLEVTMISDEALPNARRLRPGGRSVLPRRPRRHRASSWCSATARRRSRATARCSGVRTESGRVVECDFVVVGAGATPNVELGQRAGLDTDNGILVDPRLQSSAPNVFAAGDIANHWHPFYEQRVRVEHWANALNQGPAAARSMLGDQRPVRRAAVLLLRPVRRRHGVLGAARRPPTRSCSAVTVPAASSSPSGCATASSRPG